MSQSLTHMQIAAPLQVVFAVPEAAVLKPMMQKEEQPASNVFSDV